MISVTELRSGTVFSDNGAFLLVLSYEHIKMGRGSGNVKVKVRNLANGAVVEKSFITGARVQDVSLSRRKVQFLYKDNLGFHFMDFLSFEQFTLPNQKVLDNAPYLKEGLALVLFAVNDDPLYLELPKILDYIVAQTGGAARGNTVGASFKDALLENGLVVKVPLFIKNGDIVRVDSRTGQYAQRAKLL